MQMASSNHAAGALGLPAVEKEASGSSLDTSSSSITEHEAVQIFHCRPNVPGQSRSFETASLARALGKRYGVTSKAIRDIWNRRSWAWATRVHWTLRERQEELKEVLCKDCRARGVLRIEEACATCTEQGVAARCYR